MTQMHRHYHNTLIKPTINCTSSLRAKKGIICICICIASHGIETKKIIYRILECAVRVLQPNNNTSSSGSRFVSSDRHSINHTREYLVSLLPISPPPYLSATLPHAYILQGICHCCVTVCQYCFLVSCRSRRFDRETQQQ